MASLLSERGKITRADIVPPGPLFHAIWSRAIIAGFMLVLFAYKEAKHARMTQNY